jgi:hypothetical protein
MKTLYAILAIGMLGACTASAQNADTAQEEGSTQVSGSTSANSRAGWSSVDLPAGTKILATLNKYVDARSSKAGDIVQAQITQDVMRDGKVILNKGASLIGHVTEVQSRTNGQGQSELGIEFDRAVLKNGEQVLLHTSIETLASAPLSARGGQIGSDSSAGRALNTSSATPVGSGSTVDAVARPGDATSGLKSANQPTSNGGGIPAVERLSIKPAVGNPTQGSRIVSPTQILRLETGTQMTLKISGAAK